MQPLAHPFVPTTVTPPATATAHTRPPYQGEPENLTQLREFLVANYSLEEVKELCQDFYHLGLDFENLGGEGKSAKCREMVMWFQRRSRLKELAQALGWKPQPQQQTGASKYNINISGGTVQANSIIAGDHNVVTQNYGGAQQINIPQGGKFTQVAKGNRISQSFFGDANDGMQWAEGDGIEQVFVQTNTGSNPAPATNLPAAANEQEAQKILEKAATSQNFSAMSSRATGVFNDMTLSGMGSTVYAVVLNSFNGSGMGQSGKVFYPMGKNIVFNSSGMGSNIQPVPASWMQLLDIARGK